MSEAKHSPNTLRIAWIVGAVVNYIQNKTRATEAEISTALAVVLYRPGAGEPVNDAMSMAISEALDRLGGGAVGEVCEKIEQACDDYLVEKAEKSAAA